VPLDISFAPQTSFTHFFLSLTLSLPLRTVTHCCSVFNLPKHTHTDLAFNLQCFLFLFLPIHPRSPILLSKFVFQTAFTLSPSSLRSSRSFVDSAFMERVFEVSLPPYIGEDFFSSESVWFLRNRAKTQVKVKPKN